MTTDKKIDMLRRMMGEDDTDRGILEAYRDLAGQKIQLKVANYAINKIGAEGQIQHIENGIHRNYGSADVPDGMLQEIVPYAQAIR